MKKTTTGQKLTKPRPTSFTGIFKQKKLVEALNKEYDKQKGVFNDMLYNSKHLSNQIATFNKKKVYVKVETSTTRVWDDPKLILEPIKSK